MAVVVVDGWIDIGWRGGGGGVSKRRNDAFDGRVGGDGITACTAAFRAANMVSFRGWLRWIHDGE